MDRHSPLKLILNQRDPVMASRILRYNSYIAAARAEKVQHYQSTTAQLLQHEKKLQRALAELREQYKALEKQKAILVSQRAVRERSLRALRGKIKNKGDALKKLTRDRAELAKIIAAAQAAMSRLPSLNNAQPFSKVKGRMSWPVSGGLQNRFGAQRSGGLKWEGIMISARTGTPVRAIHSGRVVFADWLSGHGLLMIIDHGGGYMSLYARNEVLLKDAGEWIRSGDTIARSGDTGSEQGEAVYFEIRHQGKPVDPRLWCR